jgi:peptidoglycan/xylan/chitin deacetylase (PgdA/CDA1 family)
MVKRLLNLAISLLFAVGDWVISHVRRLLGQAPASKCVVLAYHSVSAGERSRFARQMDVLLRMARPVPADLGMLPSDGAAYAAVTFDDGFQNIVDNALPELRQRRIPSTLFIVTESLGSNRAWEHRGGDDTRDEQVMSAEQLSKIEPELVSIGSHTMTHPFLPSIDKNQLEQELAGSRKKLKEIVNRDVRTLSFPYGAFNQSIIESCRQAGYERVFTALPLFAVSEPNEFVTGRVGAAPTDWPIEFRLKLSGAYRWLPNAYALKRNIRGWFSSRTAKSVSLEAAQKRTA